jgi:hypothetical protein
MRSSVRRGITAAVVAIGAAGAVALTSSGAQANITRPTSYVYTDSNALAECQAQGQWEVANNGWDGFGCHPDPSVSPTAIQLWVIIAT